MNEIPRPPMPSASEHATQIYNFQSISQMYSGDESKDLQITLREYGKDSVEVELANLRGLLFQGHILCDCSFLVGFLYLTFDLFSLIKAEKVLFFLDLALQCHTERFMSRTSNLFIPATNIYDLVINEVIEDLDVHYVLIIRTKGDIFRRKPIIPIFNNLRPSFECLHVVYKYLEKKRRESIAV